MDCPRERDTTPSTFHEARHLSRNMTRAQDGLVFPSDVSLFRQLKFAPMKFKRSVAMGQ
jgi:hypothetical protein